MSYKNNTKIVYRQSSDPEKNGKNRLFGHRRHISILHCQISGNEIFRKNHASVERIRPRCGHRILMCNCRRSISEYYRKLFDRTDECRN